MSHINADGVRLLSDQEMKFVKAYTKVRPFDHAANDKLAEAFRIDFLMEMLSSLSVEGKMEIRHRISDELGEIPSAFPEC